VCDSCSPLLARRGSIGGSRRRSSRPGSVAPAGRLPDDRSPDSSLGTEEWSWCGFNNWRCYPLTLHKMSHFVGDTTRWKQQNSWGYFEVTPIDECHLVRCLGWDSTGGPCSTAPAFAVGFGFGRTCKALDLEGVASGALTTESAPFPLPLVSAPFPLYLHEGAKNILGGGGGGSPGIMSQNASHIIYMGVHWCSICIWITLHVFTGIHWCSIFISLGPTLILFSTDEHGTKLFKCV
jgi:hypothetical protein